MIYLLTQILLCLVVAALLGGAIGWLVQRSRGAQRLDAARRALAAQARQLERARSDVTMLTDDFDDLRERSRVEIDGLRQENRQLPALTDNLEKSQLLVRQMMQRHESRERELEAGKASLEERLATLQEQVVTQERSLAAAARGVDPRQSVIAANDTLTDEDTLSDDPADDSTGENPAPVASPTGAPAASSLHESVAATGSTTPANAGAEPVAVAEPDKAAGIDEVVDTETTENTPSAKRRGWGSQAIDQANVQDVGDESMDEVMEVDDDLAAELLEGIDTPSPSSADDTFDNSLNDTLDESVNIRAAVRSSTSRPRFAGANSPAGSLEADSDTSSIHPDEDEEWDDEEANATLAIEVFSMEDLHDVDDPDASSVLDDPSTAPLFRPVTRQDDLKRLHGIGAGTEKALNALGITSYPQLAELERSEIEKIAEALEIGPERIEDDDWVGNARRQLEKVLEEL